MATLTPLRPTDNTGSSSGLLPGASRWERASGAWIEWVQINPVVVPDQLNDAMATGVADGQFGVGLPEGYNGSIAYTMDVDNMPADFASMDTLSIRYSTAEVGGPYSDDLAYIFCIIKNGTTVLAAYANDLNQQKLLDHHELGGANGWSLTSGPKSGGSGTAPAYDKLLNFEYVDTSASKATWDSAKIEFFFFDSRNMGSDSATIVLVDFQLEGTYTTSGPATVTINPTKSTSASASDTAQLTATWTSPATINPVGSTSATTADTAQLSVTFLPTTITPVGSTSASTSDTAQLTVVWPIAVINPAGSSSATTSDTAQLTASWLPTTITPVGSTSATTADTAQLTITTAAPPTTIIAVGSTSTTTSDTTQLTSPGTPLAISDLAGGPGTTGEVVLTWSEPVGTQ